MSIPFFAGGISSVYEFNKDGIPDLIAGRVVLLEGAERGSRSVTLTATVTGTSGDTTVPTGTLTFLDGTASAGTANLNSSGQAAHHLADHWHAQHHGILFRRCELCRICLHGGYYYDAGAATQMRVLGRRANTFRCHNDGPSSEICKADEEQSQSGEVWKRRTEGESSSRSPAPGRDRAVG